MQDLIESVSYHHLLSLSPFNPFESVFKFSHLKFNDNYLVDITHLRLIDDLCLLDLLGFPLNLIS